MAITMKQHVLRTIAPVLSVMLIAAAPAQANNLAFTDVMTQARSNGSNGRQTMDLRLRSITQQSSSRGISSFFQTTANSNAGQTSVKGPTKSDATPANRGGGGSNLTQAIIVPAQGGARNVEVIQLGDVSGTICDCGEIVIPGGGHFPKLPFLALAAIPFFFINHDRTPPVVFPTLVPTPTPTPAPVPPQVPEPATLLLFGFGLLALGADTYRRRCAQAKQLPEVLSAREA